MTAVSEGEGGGEVGAGTCCGFANIDKITSFITGKSGLHIAFLLFLLPYRNIHLVFQWQKVFLIQ